MAFGADFNGFIQQTRPRFGANGACSAGFQAEADAQADQQRALRAGAAGHATFDEQGLAHVGLLPDLVKDLKQLGVNTSGAGELGGDVHPDVGAGRQRAHGHGGCGDGHGHQRASPPTCPRTSARRPTPRCAARPTRRTPRLLEQGCRFDQECQQRSVHLRAVRDLRRPVRVQRRRGLRRVTTTAQDGFRGPGDNDCVDRRRRTARRAAGMASASPGRAEAASTRWVGATRRARRRTGRRASPTASAPPTAAARTATSTPRAAASATATRTADEPVLRLGDELRQVREQERPGRDVLQRSASAPPAPAAGRSPASSAR